jgi:hypothetical protein
MSMRIHICNDETMADLIIQVEKARSPNENTNPEKMLVPDVMVFDHSTHVDNPNLLNKNKICVVFRDPEDRRGQDKDERV